MLGVNWSAMQLGRVCIRILLLHVLRQARWAVPAACVVALVAVSFVASSAAASGSRRHHDRPRNHFRPRIVGKPTVGVVLRATRGAWTRPRPVVYEFRWFRCLADRTRCRRIAGAARPRYTPSRRDLGKTLRVTVTARNAAGSGRATSRPSRVVQASGNTRDRKSVV